MVFKWYNNDEKGALDAFDIRQEVFCKEIGFSQEAEFDGTDGQALHLVCYENGKAVCTARILKEEQGVYHFGRLCSPVECRGKGYGKRTVLECIKKCKELGAYKIILGAKHDKISFYQKLGFTSYGDVFLDDGIPHLMMKKEI